MASVVDLKAELSRKTEEFRREKAAGQRAVPRKSSVWASQNAGVSQRAARDEEAHRQANKTWEQSIETLEKGARLYERLQRGEVALTADIEENSLVDFQRKRMERSAGAPAGAADAAAADVELEDPWVEYDDEFGRTRTCRRSEIPPEIKEMQRRREEEQAREAYARATGFVRASSSAGSGDDRDGDDDDSRPKRKRTLVEHYDADEEIRNKGVGFFQFSRDEDERARQLRELKELRNQTVAQQQKTEKAKTTSKLAARLEAAKKKQLLAQRLDASNPAKMAEVQAKAESFLEDMEKELKELPAPSPPPPPEPEPEPEPERARTPPPAPAPAPAAPDVAAVAAYWQQYHAYMAAQQEQHAAWAAYNASQPPAAQQEQQAAWAAYHASQQQQQQAAAWAAYNAGQQQQQQQQQAPAPRPPPFIPPPRPAQH